MKTFLSSLALKGKLILGGAALLHPHHTVKEKIR